MKENLKLSRSDFNTSKITTSLVFIFWVFFLDQASKYYLFKYTLIEANCNYGFAFGILPNVFNVFVSILVLLLLSFFVLKSRDSLRAIALSLVIGGGLANVFDRLYRYCVVDFINLKVFPSFNIADVFVFIGVALFLVSFLFRNKSANDGS